MTQPKPTREGVARDLRELRMDGGEKIRLGTILPFSDIDTIATFALRFREEGVREALEQAAMLHESMNVACDHEREHGDPGAGAMAVCIEYRDAIRRLAEPQEVEGDDS